MITIVCVWEINSHLTVQYKLELQQCGMEVLLIVPLMKLSYYATSLVIGKVQLEVNAMYSSTQHWRVQQHLCITA